MYDVAYRMPTPITVFWRWRRPTPPLPHAGQDVEACGGRAGRRAGLPGWASCLPAFSSPASSITTAFFHYRRHHDTTVREQTRYMQRRCQRYLVQMALLTLLDIHERAATPTTHLPSAQPPHLHHHYTTYCTWRNTTPCWCTARTGIRAFHTAVDNSYIPFALPGQLDRRQN